MKHNKYWFKPKKRGYGAYPVTWEGYALILGFIIVVFFLASYVLLKSWELYLGGLLIAIGILWKVSEVKTKEEWKWRWKK